MFLKQLPYKSSRAVIINCSTKLFSILALASVLKNTDLNILVVDCESNDGSFDHFLKIKKIYGERVELIKLPLKPHGLTLDFIFNGVDSDYLLLVDSDLEVLTPNIYNEMLNRLVLENAYGSGLIHAGEWMKKNEHGVADGTTYFMERMWIPLTLLNTKKIREVLQRGGSFLAKRDYRNKIITKKLTSILSKRFRMPGLRNYPHFLDVKIFNEVSPCVKEYDTGAQIHEIAKSLGFTFEKINNSFWSDVHHFDGITRAKHHSFIRSILFKLGVFPEEMENNLKNSETIALTRIKEKYPEFLFL